MLKSKRVMLGVPRDLTKILSHNTKVLAQWQSLTPIAQRDFISWIDAAKLAETRKRRVESVPSRLASGKRRPCCYAIVPMDLYKALSKNAKAKSMWGSLTPDEKRDVVSWVGVSTQAEQLRKVSKACQALARGRKHP